MSILYKNDLGYFISHKEYIDKIYADIFKVDDTIKCLNPKLFEILTPYKVSKTSNKNCEYENFSPETNEIKETFTSFQNELLKNSFLFHAPSNIKNTDALNAAENIYNLTGLHLVDNALGANIGPTTTKKIQETTFLFPENAKFFCKDVAEIKTHISEEKYDLILLDPPWWNKYIRRKRKKCDHAYKMMFNEDLKNIPVENLLKNDGLVVVWCTNSPQHINALQENIFPKWQVELQSEWFWLKITKNGEPVCSFNKPLGKQPFERIVFACKKGRNLSNPVNKKLVLSVPSAIHSHKPPLVELLRPFLPENPKCLEIFARYLLPNWTSYGKEALRLQHGSLYT